MNNTVAHFIRKSSQLKASFISSQIRSYINYRPVVIYRYESKKDDGGFADFNANGLRVLGLSRKRGPEINFRYLRKISRGDVRKVLCYLDDNQVTVLHFHYGNDAAIYSDVMRLSGRPSVVSFYGYDASSFRTRLMGVGGYLLRKRLFPYVSKVLAMSPDMANDLLRMGCPEEKITIHYYGSEVNRFFLLRDHLNVKPTTEFLIISGLEPQKGHRFLLEAFKRAHDVSMNIRLKIVGSGSIEREIRNFINRNGMGSYVSLSGKVTFASERHMDELSKADVFVHPSVTAKNGDKEGIPGAIVEAMAAGLPIISTRHAGIPYIINNRETGILVNEWDVPGLTSAILELASDAKLRAKLGKCSQSFAAQHLNVREKESELEDIYASLISDS